MDRIVRSVSHYMAILGGIVLLLLVAITCLSVAGRLINTIGHSGLVETYLPFAVPFLTAFKPINGDFELVEAGVAFAIMACLPLCQLNRGHATVEIFTNFLPVAANRVLALVWEALFAFVLIIIAWRLYVGTTDKMRYGETTFMLQFPIWWGYAACAFAAAIACLVALYSVYLHAKDLSTSIPEENSHDGAAG